MHEGLQLWDGSEHVEALQYFRMAGVRLIKEDRKRKVGRLGSGYIGPCFKKNFF
jgi:hypothetical protein